jgi:hypothetical protein
MTVNNINIQEDKLSEICNRYKIRELALFGSALRKDFTENSDVDLLYVFEENTTHGLFYVAEIKEEFEKLFGRPVDFVSRKAIERSRNIYRKKAILENVKVIYAA